MEITSKGRSWEIAQSWWILLTFTIGFFGWAAFLYVGIKTAQRKWIKWGVVYAIPFMLAMAIPGFSGTSIGAMSFVVICIVSVVHAFRIRKEFLLRLEAQQARGSAEEIHVRRRIAEEYGTSVPAQNTPKLEKRSPNSVPQAEAAGQPVVSTPAKPEPVTRSQAAALLDINRATEQDIAALPGVGVILAKKAIALREKSGSFQSLEDFGEALSLKPHIVDRIRPMVTFSKIVQSEQSGGMGRLVDF